MVINVSENEIIIVSSHGEKRMKERGVSAEQVLEIFTTYDSSWAHTSGNTINYQKEIGEHLIKIGVKLRKGGKHILVTTTKKRKQ